MERLVERADRSQLTLLPEFLEDWVSEDNAAHLLALPCSKCKRALYINPPASSYAIMRRACPYRRENHGPGKDVLGEA